MTPCSTCKPRVHLEEEVALVRDQELDGADARVADLLRDAHRGIRELGEQARRNSRRRRLFEHLLVSALHGAIPAAEREHHAVLVGGDLHLDVAAARDLALDEEASVAERGARLGAGRRECGGEILGARDDADAASAAARGGLHDHRIADARRVLGRLRRVLDHAFAPRRDGNSGSGRDLLGGDLVAEPAHGLGRGAEEADAGLA